MRRRSENVAVPDVEIRYFAVNVFVPAVRIAEWKNVPPTRCPPVDDNWMPRLSIAALVVAPEMS